MTHLPEQTTQLLIDLCTGALTTSAGGGSNSNSNNPAAQDDALSPTASTKNTTTALQNLSILPFAGTPNDTGSIHSDSTGLNGTSTPNGMNDNKTHHRKELSYTPPSARIFMPAFVERPDCLVMLLERVYEKRWGSSSEKLTMTSDAASIRSYGNDKHHPNGTNTSHHTLSPQEKEERKTIWNTLLELYLMDEHPVPRISPQMSTQNNHSQLNDRERHKRRKEFRVNALALLKDDSVEYDTNQALVLCQLKQFDEGVVYLYEKTCMYTDILRFWMEKEETDRVIESVRKYG